MDNPRPETTRGVPWGDHNETESSSPDPRRDEYVAEEGTDADERAGMGKEGDDRDEVPPSDRASDR